MSRSQCQHDRIDSFLDGSMPSEKLTAFEEHLETCTVCETELESRVANQQFWSDAKRFLSGSHADIETQRNGVDAVASLRTDCRPDR